MRYGTVPLFTAVGQNTAALLLAEAMFAWQESFVWLSVYSEQQHHWVPVVAVVGIFFLSFFLS